MGASFYTASGRFSRFEKAKAERGRGRVSIDHAPFGDADRAVDRSIGITPSFCLERLLSERRIGYMGDWPKGELPGPSKLDQAIHAVAQQWRKVAGQPYASASPKAYLFGSLLLGNVLEFLVLDGG